MPFADCETCAGCEYHEDGERFTGGCDTCECCDGEEEYEKYSSNEEWLAACAKAGAREVRRMERRRRKK